MENNNTIIINDKKNKLKDLKRKNNIIKAKFKIEDYNKKIILFKERIKIEQLKLEIYELKIKNNKKINNWLEKK